MFGWIIYNREDAKKNEKYIKWHIDKFKAEGIELKLIFTDEIDFKFLPSFAVVRAIRPDITKKLEELGVRCFNNGFVSEICNDKAICYKYVSENGIEILPTYYSVDEIKEFPIVIKPKNSHGGDRVKIAENYKELVSIMPLYDDDNYVMQAVASNTGRDVRVYVMGNEIAAAMLRKSEHDFRSNFCLGGSASVYNLNSEEICKVENVIKLFDFDFVGIDFVFNNGKMVFNEIEDVVGSRMLYTYTDIDVVDLYVKYILKRL